jgi:signal transduction histidine kinase
VTPATESGPAPNLGPLSVALTLGGLAFLTGAVASEARAGLGGRHLAVLLALLVAVASWVGWVIVRARPARIPSKVGAACLALMAVTGGALMVAAPVAGVFVGVAALGATLGWALDRALWLAALGPLAALITALATGHRLSIVLGAVAASLVGAMAGIGRRQSQERAAQAALIEVSEARAEAEAARAELLAGRNHLARELHDVLAHTLSALSLQLEALDALIGAGPAPTPEVRAQLDGIKRLVREGLDEARGAVRALREGAPPLEDQLARLAGDRHAGIQISGTARPLPPDVSLALYRVAQEALTNVVKHAPGADAEIRVGFNERCVTLSVANGPADSNGSPDIDGAALADYGSGYGLQGIRERVLLIGGRVEAGPADGGWVVEAEVPA